MDEHKGVITIPSIANDYDKAKEIKRCLEKVVGNFLEDNLTYSKAIDDYMEDVETSNILAFRIVKCLRIMHRSSIGSRLYVDTSRVDIGRGLGCVNEYSITLKPIEVRETLYMPPKPSKPKPTIPRKLTWKERFKGEVIV